MSDDVKLFADGNAYERRMGRASYHHPGMMGMMERGHDHHGWLQGRPTLDTEFIVRAPRST